MEIYRYATYRYRQLTLWVRHTGKKVWVTDYKFNNKRQSYTIGKYPVISLLQARQQHQEIGSYKFRVGKWRFCEEKSSLPVSK